MQETKNIIARFYLIAAFCLMPLYYDDGYFNTLSAKASAFTVSAGIVLVMGTLLCVVSQSPKGFKGRVVAYFKDFEWLDWMVAAFGAAALLSAVFSDYRMEAFTGSNGWKMGALTLLLLCFTYFYMSRNYIFDRKDWGFLFASVLVIYGLGVLNGIGYDPLGMHTNLIEKEVFEYIATIGNVNSYAGFLSLTVPVIAVLYLHTEDKWGKRLEPVLLLLGLMNLFMSNSDGSFLGVGGAMLFVMYDVLKKPALYERFLTEMFLFGLSGGAVALLLQITPNKAVTLSGIAGFVITSKVWALVLGAAVLLLLFNRFFLKERMTQKAAKSLARVYAVVILLVIAVCVYYTAKNFSGSWGTKRGYIWMFAMDIFGESSFLHKIFGVGADCFGIPTMEMFGDFVQEKWGERVANAHNEYLQYLVTTGILGAVSYIGLYVSAWKTGWKKERSIWRTAAFAGVVGYMAQAFVNNPQASNMAMLFLLLAFLRNPSTEDAA